jgi:hypothetical protein
MINEPKTVRGHDWRNYETCQCGERGCRSYRSNLRAAFEQEMNSAPAANYEEDDYNAGFVAGLDRAKSLLDEENS